MTKVKICGITDLEDALLVESLGADMLGLNFFERSPRYVSRDTASEICSRLPDQMKKVGVFVNADIDGILSVCSAVPLDVIQLHGDESVSYEAELRARTELETIKAVRVHEGFDIYETVNFDSIILLDTFQKGEYGGTGQSFDWQIAKDVWTLVPSLILAGGLRPENVAEAVRTVGPYAVDVASGVESSPGKKDPKKVEAFIRNAKSA
ncbi:MAG TPA: phosphoribosylanthranilate isomerase [Pyrinomonadaceae bacterium]|nr:phosphoribosylanthranilate isomerase [Pyrinomonadaceae bacterium]HMP64845.1 phosphoribosylanthranilate isomerase [Pyrinomonadaceae bacterium]